MNHPFMCGELARVGYVEYELILFISPGIGDKYLICLFDRETDSFYLSSTYSFHINEPATDEAAVEWFMNNCDSILDQMTKEMFEWD